MNINGKQRSDLLVSLQHKYKKEKEKNIMHSE